MDRRRWSWVCGIALATVALGCAAGAGAKAPGSGAEPATPGLNLPPAPKTLNLTRPALAGNAAPAPVLAILQAELDRALGELRAQDPPPYYLGYAVYEREVASIEATDGALLDSSGVVSRALDVELRVGSPELDNTHGDETPLYPGSVDLPIADADVPLRHGIWLATESAYQDAAKRLIEVRAAKEVEAEASDDSPDFSREPPVRYLEEPTRPTFDRGTWEARVRELSGVFRRFPAIEHSYVKLRVSGGTRYLVSSEGTVLQTGDHHSFIAYGAELTAEDGTVVSRDEEANAFTVDRLPSQAELTQRVERLVGELMALRAAPPGEPYVGPALLDGLAAAVMMHEVLGHRVEGHRLKSDWEGQTFAKKIGQRVMLPGFDVYDDPSLSRLNGTPLNGFFAFDDEGVRGQRTRLIEDGVFRGFLMSRTPIRGFPHSNGHGRKQPGFRVVSRQANLVVEPEHVTTHDALKQALLDEVRRQKLPYGLRINRVMGGVTQTTADDPQAFQLDPVLVYRVFPDGHEELIRDVTLEGTPLSLLANIVGAANDFAVFNGLCGAESGEIPVAAVSPSVLISRIEVARGSKVLERPPLLSPPGAESTRSEAP